MNETDKAWRERLYSQIVEAYGKALYTYTTQQKAAGLKERSRNILSIVQITLTSISSVGIISSLIASQYLVSLIAGLCSALSLALNLYSRGRDYSREVSEHRAATDGLWPIIQDYLSLLTDFDDLGTQQIRESRKGLQDRLEQTYLSAPRTNDKAYRLAQIALKRDSEQSFEVGECDQLLPIGLRSSKRQEKAQ